MKHSIVLAAALIAVAALSLPVLADASTTVDLVPAVHSVTEVLIDLVIGLGFVGALWLGAVLKKKWGIDITAQVTYIEANYRDALHKAVDTQVDKAIAQFGPNLKIDVGSPIAKQIIDGVLKSVPDAAAWLKANDAWIITKAQGLADVKINGPMTMPAPSLSP